MCPVGRGGCGASAFPDCPAGEDCLLRVYLPLRWLEPELSLLLLLRRRLTLVAADTAARCVLPDNGEGGSVAGEAESAHIAIHAANARARARREGVGLKRDALGHERLCRRCSIAKLLRGDVWHK